MSPDRPPVRRAIVVALALAVLVGCGGQGDRAPAETAAVAEEGEASPRVLRGAVDVACVAAQREQERIRREQGGTQLTLDDRARLLVELAPPRVKLAEKLASTVPDADGADRARLEKLAAAARRRGVASTRAGELWERGAAEERIARAAAAEHDERELFVEIAGRLGLADCAEVLAPRERRAIAETIERGLASPAARERCGALGERLLAERFDDLAGCIAEERRKPHADAAEVIEIQGMDEVFATAQVKLGGGGLSDRARVRITYESGAYRIDKIDLASQP